MSSTTPPATPPATPSTGLADDTSVLINNIKNIIGYIGTTFVTDAQRTGYTSKVLTGTFVDAIVNGYSVFKTKYASSLPATVSGDVVAQNILYRSLIDIPSTPQEKENKLYKALDAAKLNEFNPATMELNYSKVLVANSDLLKELNKVMNAYSFLTEKGITLYRSGNAPVPIENYLVNAQNITETTVNPADLNSSNPPDNSTSKNIKDVIGSVSQFDFLNNDVFMIRRLLLMHVLLSNIYISMWLYEKNTNDTHSTNYLKNISNTANILINLNKNFSPSSDGSTSSNNSIINNLRKSINTYKNNTQTIDDVNRNVQDIKMSLISEDNIYNSGTVARRRTTRYEWITFAVYSIALLAIIAIAVYPLDKKIKLAILGGILAIMIVAALILYGLIGKRMEGFVGSKEEGFANYYLINPSTFTTGQQNINKENLLNIYNNAFLSQANDYLNITLYLGVILQSSKTYGGINSTIQREISHYKQLQDMLGNTSNKYKEATSLTRLDTITSTARSRFFIYIGLTLALAIIAYVLVGDNIVYQPYIFAVAGLLIVLNILGYMYTISKHVRRDPSKFYWDRPSDIEKIN